MKRDDYFAVNFEANVIFETVRAVSIPCYSCCFLDVPIVLFLRLLIMVSRSPFGDPPIRSCMLFTVFTFFPLQKKRQQNVIFWKIVLRRKSKFVHVRLIYFYFFSQLELSSLPILRRKKTSKSIFIEIAYFDNDSFHQHFCAKR